MSRSTTFDPAAKPPEILKIIYKSYQKASTDALASDADIVDFSKDQEYIGHPKVKVERKLDGAVLGKVFALFSGSSREDDDAETKDLIIYKHGDLSGIPLARSRSLRLH